MGEQNIEPAKETLYRYIFISEYNLDFHRPKIDSCNKSEEFKVAKQRDGVKDRNGRATTKAFVGESFYADKILRMLSRYPKPKLVPCFIKKPTIYV